MKRTTVELPIRPDQIDAVLQTVAAKLTPLGFQEKLLDGEQVWSKGDGVVVVIQCLSVGFTGTSVILQAWIRDALTGESNLEGFVAALPKRKMKRVLDELCAQIRQLP